MKAFLDASVNTSSSLYDDNDQLIFDKNNYRRQQQVRSPQINYAIELYLNTCDSYFDKICKLNNKILRILQNKHLHFPVVGLYKNFNALPPLKLHEQQIFM